MFENKENPSNYLRMRLGDYRPVNITVTNSLSDKKPKCN